MKRWEKNHHAETTQPCEYSGVRLSIKGEVFFEGNQHPGFHHHTAKFVTHPQFQPKH
jgi:hypothetical protein